MESPIHFNMGFLFERRMPSEAQGAVAMGAEWRM
jgi:hypothetical protein